MRSGELVDLYYKFIDVKGTLLSQAQTDLNSLVTDSRAYLQSLVTNINTQFNTAQENIEYRRVGQLFSSSGATCVTQACTVGSSQTSTYDTWIKLGGFVPTDACYLRGLVVEYTPPASAASPPSVVGYLGMTYDNWIPTSTTTKSSMSSYNNLWDCPQSLGGAPSPDIPPLQSFSKVNTMERCHAAGSFYPSKYLLTYPMNTYIGTNGIAVWRWMNTGASGFTLRSYWFYTTTDANALIGGYANTGA